eukprot:scaffold21.g2171.t1
MLRAAGSLAKAWRLGARSEALLQRAACAIHTSGAAERAADGDSDSDDEGRRGRRDRGGWRGRSPRQHGRHEERASLWQSAAAQGVGLGGLDAEADSDLFAWGNEDESAEGGSDEELAQQQGQGEEQAQQQGQGQEQAQRYLFRGGADDAVHVSEPLRALMEESERMSEAEFVARFERVAREDDLPGDREATPDDYRLLAEAIDLYFQVGVCSVNLGGCLIDDDYLMHIVVDLVLRTMDLYFYFQVAPVADSELDGLEEEERQELAFFGHAIKWARGVEGQAFDPRPPTEAEIVNTAPPGRLAWEVLGVDEEAGTVHWGADLTEGRAPDPWANAQLSESSKRRMYELHKEDPEEYSVEALAALFRIRQQRVMAILALKEMEAQAAAAGEVSEESKELAEVMEEEVFPECHETTGSGERHVVILPSYPQFQEIDQATAISRLEAKLGKRAEEITDDDLTPELAREVLGYVSKEEVEERLAAAEEASMVADFRRNLEYNMGKAGQSISRRSRGVHPPRRPRGGWSLVVRPLGGKQQQQPFVATPDGKRRELTPDEQLYLQRQTPQPRRKVV